MNEFVYTAHGVTEIDAYLDSFWPEGMDEWDWDETLKRAGFEHAFDLGEDAAFLQISLYLAHQLPPVGRYYGFAEIDYADTGHRAYFMFPTPIDSLDFLRQYAPTARLVNKMEDEQGAAHHG